MTSNAKQEGPTLESKFTNHRGNISAKVDAVGFLARWGLAQAPQVNTETGIVCFEEVNLGQQKGNQARLDQYPNKKCSTTLCVQVEDKHRLESRLQGRISKVARSHRSYALQSLCHQRRSPAALVFDRRMSGRVGGTECETKRMCSRAWQ